MSVPRLLDLFCGVGGCSVGYARAGFEVTGVDLVRRPDYPHRFVAGDALAYLERHAHNFDVVAASPPCKRWTPLRARARPALFEPHPDHLGPTLAALERLEVPVWVVENVPGAPMPAGAVMLCGSMFGLRVRRHRLFASSVRLPAPPPCAHAEQGPPLGVYGTGGADAGRAARGGGGGVKVAGAEAGAALGIGWSIEQRGLSQAVPPAYTEWIGRALLTEFSRGPRGEDPLLVHPPPRTAGAAGVVTRGVGER